MAARSPPSAALGAPPSAALAAARMSARAPPSAALLAAAAAALAMHAAPTCAAPVFGAVVADASAPHGVRFLPGAPPPAGALAWGSYDVGPLNTTGWAVLDVAMSGVAGGNDTLAAYAAGYLEGFLTAREMADFTANTGADAANPPKLQAFLDTNWAWMAGQVAANGSVYWKHVGALMAQVVGLADGQGDAASAGGGGPPPLGFRVVYNAIIQGGDIFNLAQVYGASEEQLARTGVLRRLAARGRVAGVPARAHPRTGAPLRGRADHCSALIRLLPDMSDVFATHTTWSALENMLRIVKRHSLPFTNLGGGTPVPGAVAATSSYPAYGSYSSDDFYTLSSGLVALETTINNDNETLALQFASTAVVLEWARNVLANRLAADAPSWVATFSAYASGTYTNSWMVLDTNLLAPGRPVPPGAFLVAEEMPGHIAVHDRGDVLSARGFWSSFNVASDPYIFDISGQQALVDQYGGPTGPGAFFTLANTSRARIFDRDAPGVVDDATLQAVIRYNNAPHDALSTLACGSHPPFSFTNAIADRSDLNDPHGDYLVPDIGFGDGAAIDAKYTRASWVRAANKAAGEVPLALVCGPPNTDVPTFAWANATVQPPHAGLPEVYNFAWRLGPWGPSAWGAAAAAA
jgi:hypothetical protein